MATKTEINKIMYILTLIGGIIAIFEAAIGVSNIKAFNFDYDLISRIVAIVIAVLILLSALKPDDPIPFNWVVLLVFSILLIIFGSFAGGIIVLVAAILGLFSEADVI
ncbi:MAG: hypothetical protein GF311_15395 [Candidatus Lokiarchaeota archaeon]|nr:hypothetical protein [Candidatus Lokiarchaeota archaeon]